MDIKLPPLGEGADSGTVVNVFVKPGDTITKGQTILELENEKAIASIPADHAGTVSQVYVNAGEKLSVGQRILTLSGDVAAGKSEANKGRPSMTGTDQAFTKSMPTAKQAKPDLTPLDIAEEEEVPAPVAAPVASPSIRRIARELGIDLGRVRGSEAGGRIVMGDIRAYIEKLQKVALRSKVAAEPAASKPAPEPVDFAKWGPVAKQPLTQLRQVIARRMWESWNTVPHVTQFDEADFTTLNALRKKFAPSYEAKGTRLTLTPLILRALVDTLKQHPTFNSSLDEAAQELVLKRYFHIGIAVDTEQGLLVPVIRDADKKSLLDLSKELEALAQRARERKVSREEMQGGTFTISNQGAIGGAHFTPIVNRPEVAILGIGRGTMKPVVRDGKIEPRLLVPLALSYDHRVIDGGSAARFVVDFVKALEEFPEPAVAL